MNIDATLGLAFVAALQLPSQSAPSAATVPPAFNFTDEATARGITWVNHCGDPVKKRYLVEEIGCGCALFDMDGDGDLDAFLVDACRLEPQAGDAKLDRDWTLKLDGQCRLYRNEGPGERVGHFTDVTDESGAGLRAFGQGVTAADYDGDGDLDLYVTCFGPNHLLQNDGHGKFVDVTEKAGVGDDHWSVGAAFFDADGDGDLDLYVGNYFAMAVARDPKCWRKIDCLYFDIPAACGPKGMVPEPDTFYVNDGDGTFHDASESSGIRKVKASFALGVTAFDYDLDGDVDLYVGNDSRSNYLFDNDGTGHFTEMGDLAGCAVNRDGVGQASMGLAVGDFDGNGFADIATTNFAHDDNTVFANQGGGMFLDATTRLGFGTEAYLSLGWATEFADFDQDGDLDFFVANGHVYPEADRRAPELTYKQRNLLYRNEGRNEGVRFAECGRSAGPGFERLASYRGAAIGDVDDDGDLDLLITAQDEVPSLLINHASDGAPLHWLELELRGKGKNAFAIGARVVAECGTGVGGRKFLRQLRAGATFASSSDLRLHFGLGAATKIDRLVVTWPDGTTQEFRDVVGDRIVRLEQGGEIVPRSRP